MRSSFVDVMRCALSLVLADVPTTLGGIFVLVIIAFSICLYFLPSFIAFRRQKSNKIPIFVLNLFLGWSLIGWVVSLVWSLSQEQQQVVIQQNFGTGATPPIPGRTVIDQQGEV